MWISTMCSASCLLVRLQEWHPYYCQSSGSHLGRFRTYFPSTGLLNTPPAARPQLTYFLDESGTAHEAVTVT